MIALIQPRLARFSRHTGCGIALALCLSMAGGCKRAPENAAPAPKNPLKAAGKESAAGGTNAVKTASLIPRSVFSTNVNEGKDPFFPESGRRVREIAERASAQKAPQPVRVGIEHLKLNGLWPSKTRPLALINKTPLAPGEEADIAVAVTNAQKKVEQRKIAVRCVEIRKSSVTVSVEGMPGIQELFLQTKF